MPMGSEEFTPIIVTTTSDERNVLEAISNSLIGKKLAACVQISGPITSCYQWQGQLETAEEWQCVIKTSKENFAAVESLIRELHSYDEPQLIAIPIVAGSVGYLSWLQNSISEL